MPQICFSNKSRSKPVLEFRQANTGEIRRVTVETCPFSIGRADSCDLQIESVQISREHAQIVNRNGAWFIRDLHSTNGTQVNGKAVEEALLSDGDILLIAETEVTFVAPSAAQFQRMVTQPMLHRQPAVPAALLPAELSASRALVETTLWQAIPIDLMTIASLGTKACEAHFAGLPELAEPVAPRRLFGMQHPAAKTFRDLYRLRAAEMATDSGDVARLFVSLDSTELLAPHRWRGNLEQVLELLPLGSELGVSLQLPPMIDVLQMGATYHELRSRRLLIAYEQFEGSGKQVMQLDKYVPDYLVLSDSMLNSLTAAPHALRRLESVLSACDELAIKPVLPTGRCERTLALCQQIGYDLALQSRAAWQKPVLELVPVAG